MKSARCLLVGRNISKEILSDSELPVRIPVTIPPIEVEVTIRLITVEVRHVDVAIGVTPLICTGHHLGHCFLSNSKSCISLGFSPSVLYQVFSFQLKDGSRLFFQAYPKEIYAKQVLDKQTKALALIFSLSLEIIQNDLKEKYDIANNTLNYTHSVIIVSKDSVKIK